MSDSDKRKDKSAAEEGGEVIIGIDLGTTNSLGAYMPVEDSALPYCFAGDDGNPLLPSVISFDEKAGVLIGEQALDRRVEAPETTVYSIKRLIGRSPLELTEYLGKLPYETYTPPHRKVIFVKILDKSYSPEELSAIVLREIRARAEAALGKPVSSAVITVPAYFDDSQRQATRDAGRLAGLDVKRIINEPTAAALAYGLDKKKEGLLAVYDLGGGTFDISILRVHEGVFQVMATRGDTQLGGDDFDMALAEAVSEEFREKYGLDSAENPRAKMAFKRAAENCKMALSEAESAEFRVGYEKKSGVVQVARDEFETVIAPWIEKTMDSCREAVADARVEVSEFDAVLLVGGSTRVPAVREAVRKFFGREPEAGIDPDRVVALGAAVQGAILSGTAGGALLMDVIPLSLGMETIGGAVAKMIMRNTPIPCEASEYFTSYADKQTGIDLHVVQGEREMAKDCRSLGRFRLKIPPLPAGMVKVKTSFRVDVNGILSVSALEERSGNKVKVEITPSHGLTREEIDRMLTDSLLYAQEDFDAIRLLAVRTELERVIIATRRGLKQSEGRAPQEMLEVVRQAFAPAEAARESDDPELLENVLKRLQDATIPLAEWLVDDATASALKGMKIKDTENL